MEEFYKVGIIVEVGIVIDGVGKRKMATSYVDVIVRVIVVTIMIMLGNLRKVSEDSAFV